MPTFQTLLRSCAAAGALAIALPLLGDALEAQRRGGPPAARVADRRADPGAPLLRGITLTDDQRTQVDAWQAARRAERDSLAAAMRAQRQGSAPRVRPDSATMAARRDALRAQAQANAQSLRALLTPEQQVTFDANARELALRMQERGGGRKGWGRRGVRAPMAPADTSAR